MILQALHQLAQDEGLMDDPDYEPKPVAWLVRVGDGGQLIGIEGTRQTPPQNPESKKKPRPVAKTYSVPRQPGRTSGDKAFFLCDKVDYVFGQPSPMDKNAEKTARKCANRFSLFHQQVEACADATGDPGITAVRDLLAAVAEGRTAVTLSDECAPNDLLAFIYAPDVDVLVHQRPAVRAYWKQQRQQPADGQADAVDRPICLVTGQPVNEPGLFPLIKRVPGGTTSGVALVSFNASAFLSHGWAGNENASVGRDVAEACATALNRLLHNAYPDPHDPGQVLHCWNIRISDDTVVCFWGRGQQGGEFCNAFASLLNPDPQQVKDVYHSIWQGRRPRIDDPSAFYVLTLSGSQGRAIVRDWIETTLNKVIDNLTRYFDDLAIVRNTPKPKGRELPPVLPLHVLLRSLAPMGDEKGIPDPMAAQFVRAAIYGGKFPLSVLQRALERMRSEIGRTDWADMERRDARAALIKAVLNRTIQTQPEMTTMLDMNNKQPGYLLGQLMAVLERLQLEALGNPNASVVDRYFAAASATPRMVFTRLLKNARHHASKAKDESAKRGTVRWLEGQIDRITSSFEPGLQGLPAYLSLEQQGLFVLGYHHQRYWLWMSKEQREQQTPAEPVLAEQVDR